MRQIVRRIVCVAVGLVARRTVRLASRVLKRMRSRAPSRVAIRNLPSLRLLASHLLVRRSAQPQCTF